MTGRARKTKAVVTVDGVTQRLSINADDLTYKVARRYATPEDLDAAVEAYFESLGDPKDKDARPPSMSGLARHIGFKRVTSLSHYDDLPVFGDILSDARLRIEQWIEERLMSPLQPAGPIFALKYRFNWEDRKVVDTNVNVSIAETIRKRREAIEGEAEVVDDD